MDDFLAINHGTVWTVRAVSEEAQAFAGEYLGVETTGDRGRRVPAAVVHPDDGREAGNPLQGVEGFGEGRRLVAGRNHRCRGEPHALSLERHDQLGEGKGSVAPSFVP